MRRSPSTGASWRTCAESRRSARTSFSRRVWRSAHPHVRTQGLRTDNLTQSACRRSTTRCRASTKSSRSNRRSVRPPRPCARPPTSSARHSPPPGLTLARLLPQGAGRSTFRAAATASCQRRSVSSLHPPSPLPCLLQPPPSLPSPPSRPPAPLPPASRTASRASSPPSSASSPSSTTSTASQPCAPASPSRETPIALLSPPRLQELFRSSVALRARLPPTPAARFAAAPQRPRGQPGRARGGVCGGAPPPGRVPGIPQREPDVRGRGGVHAEVQAAAEPGAVGGAGGCAGGAAGRGQGAAAVDGAGGGGGARGGERGRGPRHHVRRCRPPRASPRPPSCLSFVRNRRTLARCLIRRAPRSGSEARSPLLRAPSPSTLLSPLRAGRPRHRPQHLTTPPARSFSPAAPGFPSSSRLPRRSEGSWARWRRGSPGRSTRSS